MVPSDRIAAVNRAPVRGDGGFVLYWMIAHRRAGWNHALERAVERAVELRRPLLVFEYLRSGHAFSCLRLHRLMIEGMRDNRDAFAGGRPGCKLDEFALNVARHDQDHRAGTTRNRQGEGFGYLRQGPEDVQNQRPPG